MSETPCADCGKDVQDPKDCEYFYMVWDEVWKEAGMDAGFLCVECLETRLGRQLTALDFQMGLPINDLWPQDTERLAARKMDIPRLEEPLTVWDELDEVLWTYDADFKVDVGSGCAWSGQLRVTLTNPTNEPSRSMTFFSCGASVPEQAARAVLDDFAHWMEESGEKPLPFPEWLREEAS